MYAFRWGPVVCVLAQCCDERELMRDSYYVGLIILAVHEGGLSVVAAAIH